MPYPNHGQGCHLCLPSIPLLERILVNRENQADEIMVKLAEITPPDGMRDPPPAPTACPSTTIRPEDPQVDCMKAEQRPLQDKGIPESAIRTILTATRYTTGTMYKAGGKVLLAGVAEGAKIPFARL